MKAIVKIAAFFQFLAFLNVAFCQAGLAVPASDPVSFGEWSQATNGLRARLAFAVATNINGTARGVLYLELQNVSLGDTLYVYYRAAGSPFRCELHDSDGKSVQRYGAPYDGWIPEACWLALPNDSILRFRVTLGGFGVPHNAGLFVAGGVEDSWVIPPSDKGDHFLSGTLAIAAPKDETRPRVWEGKLKLPLVKISAKSR
jgi:hypothetical protein